jgi:hypothetical protein
LEAGDSGLEKLHEPLVNNAIVVGAFAASPCLPDPTEISAMWAL